MKKKKFSANIGYVGEDFSQWRSITRKYNQLYPNLDFHFFEFSKFNDKKYLKIIPRILFKKLDIIYIDFSKRPIDNLYLIKQLSRLNSTKPIEIVALLERDYDEHLLNRMILLGVKLFDIKDDEVHDCVYNPMSVKYLNKAHQPDYALIKLKDYWQVHKYLRINYLTTESIKVETDADWKKNQLVTLKTNIPEKIMNSDKMVVRGKYEKGNYYHFKNSYFLDFEFVSPFRKKKVKGYINDEGVFTKLNKSKTSIPEEELITKIIKEPRDKAEYDELLANAKKRLSTWFETKKELSNPKFTKVLIIEKDLNLYFQAKEALGEYAFSCRLQPYLEKPLLEINHYRPDVIGFQLEFPPEVEEDEEDKEKVVDETDPFLNDLTAFSKLIYSIKKIENYEPIVILFCCEESSEDVQKHLEYKKILSYTHDVSFDLIFDLAAKQKGHREDSKDLGDKLYISKKEDISYASVVYDIEVVGMTESELFFNSSKSFQEGSVLRIEEPMKTTLTIVKHSTKSSNGPYKDCTRALIGNTSEVEKMNIRKLINYYVNKDKLDKENEEKEKFYLANKTEEDKRQAAKDEEQKAKEEAAKAAKKTDKIEEGEK